MPSDLPFELYTKAMTDKTLSYDQIETARATATPDLAWRIQNISTLWPDIHPTVAVPLAQQGFDGYSPEVQQIAQTAVKQAALGHEIRRSLSQVKTLGEFNDQYGHLTNDEYKSLSPKEQHALHQKAQSLAAAKLDGGGGLLGTGIGPDVSLGDVGDWISHAERNQAKSEGGGVGAAEAVSRPTSKHAAPLDVSQFTSVGELNNAGEDLSALPVVGGAVAPVVRTAGLVASAPLQAIQGGIRDTVQGINDLAQGTYDPNPAHSSTQASIAEQTQYGQAIKAAVAGDNVDVGAGYLPDPQSATGLAASEAARRAAPTINGHAWTLGRRSAELLGESINQTFGTHVLEPDSESYALMSGIVDAAVALKADPAAHVLAAVGDERAAAKGFAPSVSEEDQAAGLLPTTSRHFVAQPAKESYLASPDTEAVLNDWHAKFADNPAGMMRASKWTIPAVSTNGEQTALKLADAVNTDEMRDTLAATTEFQSPLEKLGVNYKLRMATADVRALHAMPEGTINFADPNTAVKTIDDVLAGARVPVAARDEIINTYLRNPDPLAGVTAVSDAIKSQIMYFKPTTDPAKATELSTFFRNSDNLNRIFDIDQATNAERWRPGMAGSGLIVDGKPALVNGAPSLISEQWDGTAHIPDMRTIRQWTSNFSHITGTTPWHVSQTLLAAPAMIWKPFALLSARLGSKIFGEVQLNMATRGGTNIFTDPAGTIGAMMGANLDNKLGTVLDKVPGLTPQWSLSLEGKAIIADVRDEIGRASAIVHTPETLATGGYVSVPLSHPQAGFGLAETVAHMNLDPIWRGVAEAENPEAAKEWFWSGDGAKLRIARSHITSVQDEHNVANLAAGKFTTGWAIGDIANDRQAADAYLDNVVFPQIRDVTGGNSELMEGIRTGKLAGQDIYNVSGGKGLSAVDQRAAERASELIAEGEGPKTSVRLPEGVYNPKRGLQSAAAIVKSGIDHAFYALMDVPDRVLSRNLAYQQELWSEGEKLAPYLDEESHAAFLDIARKANLPDEQLARIESMPLDNTSAERLSLKQAQQIAKGNALDNIKNIVHDYSQKSQFFDMVRALIPFGDAFRLIARRWANTLAENPQGLRRLQQGITALREPGSAAISNLFGDPIPQGQGFFHTDPTSGDEVFTMPGSTWLDKSLVGVPLPLVGKVSGLSLVGAGYPGVGGPAVTIPAKWFLPDTPQFDGVRKVIFPYGQPEGKGVAGDIASEFEPAWFSKLVGDQPDQKTFNNTVKDMLASLASSGDYALHGPKAAQETQRLLEDAKNAAKWAYVVRGAAQFFSPTAPAFEPQVHDKSGRLTALATLSQQFNKKQQKLGADGAMQWLIDTFGTKNMFAAQPGSQPTAYGVPVTKEAEDWADTHADVRSKYPDTYGLFAPQGGKFDITTYEAQFNRGERVTLSGEQQVAQAEQRLGYFAYNHARDQMLTMNNGKALTPDQTRWLGDYKTELEGDFPGFNSFLASPYDSQKKLTNALGQLEKASNDPTVAHTDAGQGLKQYLAYREQAIASAKNDWGLKSPFQANKAQPLRDWLREAADEVVKAHPDFGPIWEQVYSHELKVDMKAGS